MGKQLKITEEDRQFLEEHKIKAIVIGWIGGYGKRIKIAFTVLGVVIAGTIGWDVFRLKKVDALVKEAVPGAVVSELQRRSAETMELDRKIRNTSDHIDAKEPELKALNQLAKGDIDKAAIALASLIKETGGQDQGQLRNAILRLGSVDTINGLKEVQTLRNSALPQLAQVVSLAQQVECSTFGWKDLEFWATKSGNEMKEEVVKNDAGVVIFHWYSVVRKVKFDRPFLEAPRVAVGLRQQWLGDSFVKQRWVVECTIGPTSKDDFSAMIRFGTPVAGLPPFETHGVVFDWIAVGKPDFKQVAATQKVQ